MLVKEYHGFRSVAGITIVSLAVSLLEGLNIGLLVPLLETVSAPELEDRHWMSRALENVFDFVGVPLELGPILIGMTALVIFTVGLDYMRRLMIAAAERDFTIWMRTRYMGNLVHADISYFHQERLGVLTGTLTLQAEHAGFCLRYITEIINISGLILAYMVAAFVITPELTAIAVGVMAIVTLVVQFYIRRVDAIGTEGVMRANNLQASAVETLSGIHLIKSYVLETIRWKEFTTKAEEMGDLVFRRERNRSQMFVTQDIARFGLVGVMVYVGSAVMNLEIAIIAALIFLLIRISPRISGLNTSRHNLRERLAALRAVQEILAEATAPKVIDGSKPFTELKTGIELDIGSFAYNGGAPVLQDTRFTIEEGKTTAIVGGSGAGKTTLIDMLLRFYDPNEGSIRVDGTDLREFSLADWRGSIGVVSQDVFLFNETVGSNISLGRPQGTPEGIIYAAKQAYAHEFISQLPDGYETRIGDRGWNLSGGQRQRISLARALLTNPKILILDEATSALDSESEEMIKSSIDNIKGDCTVVVVAHRTSTIQDADKIVVLQDGKIVEQGDWDSLLEEGGALANYHRLQSGIE